MALKKTGVELIAEGNAKFLSDIGKANKVIDNLGETADSVARKGFASLGKAVGGLGKVIGGLALGGAVAGIGALSAALVGGIGDAREAAKIMAQTENVIKSTGNAAGVTAEHVADLSGSLSAAAGKSLFGDDQIQESANLLLTFTNLKGGVLDAATAMSVDLAQAMGGAPADAAVQLGKALNDPIAGISALSRVGVTFTEQQKAQIKTMVEAGDVAGAQGVILAELNKEFGGSAEAAAIADGGWAQFRDRMGELAESIGGRVLPALNSLMGWLNSPEVQAGIQRLVDGLVNGVATIGTAISAVVAAFQTGGLAGVWDLILPKLQEFGTNVLAWIAQQAPLWGAQLLLWGQQFIAWVGPYIPPLLAKLGELATSAWGWVTEQAPILLEKLGEWGVQLAAWILPQIPAVLENLGRVIGNIVIWIGEQLPAIDASTKQWGESLYKWIEKVAIPGLGPAFTKFDAEMGRLMDNLMKASGDAGEKVGKEIADRISTAMSEGLPHFRDVTLNEWSEAIFTWLDETAPKVIPGTKAIGQSIIDAIKEKQAEWLPALDLWAQDILAWANETGPKVLGWVKQVGTNMILGMVNGVTEQAAKLGAAAIKAVTDAIASAKAALGIKSPSKKTRDELGKPMGEGIVVGIEDTATSVKQAIGKTILGAIQVATLAPQATKAGKDIATAVKTGLETGLDDPKSVKQIFGGKLRDAVEVAMEDVKQIMGGKLRGSERVEDEAGAAGERIGAALVAGFNRIVTGFNFGGVDMTFVPGPGNTETTNPTKGPKRATGGPVLAGRSYLVGERGPEKFVPDVSGTIVPNHRIRPPVSASQMAQRAMISNTTNAPVYNYAPTYGAAPNNPSQDFAIMQVLAR